MKHWHIWTKQGAGVTRQDTKTYKTFLAAYADTDQGPIGNTKALPCVRTDCEK